MDLSASAPQRLSASAPQRLSASAPQRLSASAPQRLSANIYHFCQFFCLLFTMMLVAAGCGARIVQDFPRTGALSAEEAGSRYSLPLVPSETNLNLGHMAPGSQRSRTFFLTNQSETLVEVAEITSSCDCLKIELPERHFAPGQKVKGSIELDLRKEPQFTGNLGIEVEGKAKSGQALFTMVVKVAVANE